MPESEADLKTCDCLPGLRRTMETTYDSKDIVR